MGSSGGGVVVKSLACSARAWAPDSLLQFQKLNNLFKTCRELKYEIKIMLKLNESTGIHGNMVNMYNSRIDIEISYTYFVFKNFKFLIGIIWLDSEIAISHPFDQEMCKCGYFRWGKISWKCWQDISGWGNFHDTTLISLGFIFAWG